MLRGVREGNVKLGGEQEGWQPEGESRVGGAGGVSQRTTSSAIFIKDRIEGETEDTRREERKGGQRKGGGRKDTASFGHESNRREEAFELLL